MDKPLVIHVQKLRYTDGWRAIDHNYDGPEDKVGLGDTAVGAVIDLLEERNLIIVEKEEAP